MAILTDASQLIGKTPLFQLKHIFKGSDARILAKMESFNPTSIKDRAVLNMIQTAIKEGKISKGSEVVEASSGNTAIAIAYCQENPKSSFFLNLHNNENNGQSHFLTTGPEIWEQTARKVDAVIIALGTCGTFDGLSRFFKSQNPEIKIIGYEPAASPVYSGGQQGKHKITGAGPGFVTDNFKRSAQHLDEIVLVQDQDALQTSREIALKEGVLVGPTSGASIWVAGQLAKKPEYKGKTIICFIYDTGERYLSTPELFPANNVERVD